MAGQGRNAVITATGVGSFPLRVIRISYGLNIIATEDQSATFKYLYTRQVQTDSFAIDVMFDSTGERDGFFNWFRGYANLAIKPSPVGSVRVQVPARQFDMTGTLISGPQLVTTPTDVVWVNTLQFNGATFTNQSGTPVTSKYVAPANSTASKYFYPNSTDLGAPVVTNAQAAAAAAKAQAQAVQNAITAVQNLINAQVAHVERITQND